jgi:hypothetical protein
MSRNGSDAGPKMERDNGRCKEEDICENRGGKPHRERFLIGMVPGELMQSRRINGVEVLGPEIFARDRDDKPLSPIGVIFPGLLLIVTGRGIHAELVALAEEFLRARTLQSEERELSAEEESEIYENVVSLLVRDATVLIRSNPEDMDRVFAADDILQRVVAKELIQFTGVHVEKVREQLRRRGERWRISPPPRSPNEIFQHIRASQVHVKTGAVYYLNFQTGERFLTYEEFLRIRPLLRESPGEALARLKEINHLNRLVNDQGAPELSFFLPAEIKLPTDALEALISVLEDSVPPREPALAEDLFDRFATAFAEATGDDLTVDGDQHTTWKNTMYCRLYQLSEKEVEEWILGLSPEFHFNVRWLPGARIRGNEVAFEGNAEPRVRNLVNYFLHDRPGLVSVNVGRVESPQTQRDRTGEEREVYLVVLGLPEGGEEIRLLRLMKWDVVHRLKQGFPLRLAIGDTIRYRDYITDRLKAAAALEVPILAYTSVQFSEELQGIGEIPVFFFDRKYVSGMVTDKIPLGYYAKEGFIVHLARFLGIGAAASMVLGRASYRSGELFFNDGDEVIQLDAEKLPVRLVISETTGSFTNSTTPLVELLPQCLIHLAAHLEKARARGIARGDLEEAVTTFAETVSTEIERMKSLLETRSAALRSLFHERTSEPGSVRARWESILDRLAETDPGELRRAILASPQLAHFMSP